MADVVVSAFDLQGALSQTRGDLEVRRPTIVAELFNFTQSQPNQMPRGLLANLLSGGAQLGGRQFRRGISRMRAMAG